MFRLLFKHLTSENKLNKVKVNDINVNGTSELLTLFGDKHTYSGAYKARKKIH